MLMIRNLKWENGRSWKPLSWLPNQEGFQFLGLFRDLTERACIVTTKPYPNNPEFQMHTVEGFSDLIGWHE